MFGRNIKPKQEPKKIIKPKIVKPVEERTVDVSKLETIVDQKLLESKPKLDGLLHSEKEHNASNKNSKLQTLLFKQWIENLRAKWDPNYVAKDYVSGLVLDKPQKG